MKQYINCEKCGEKFTIDEVDFSFNKKYNLKIKCGKCKGGTNKMSELIEKKIEEIKNQRRARLKWYKKYFEDSAIMVNARSGKMKYCKSDFQNYIAEKEYDNLNISKRKIKKLKANFHKNLYKLDLVGNDFNFRLSGAASNLAVEESAENWERIRYLLSLIEKYAEPYKEELKRKELEKLTGEYERLTGGKENCDCCGEEIRTDGRFCHQCGNECRKELEKVKNTSVGVTGAYTDPGGYYTFYTQDSSKDKKRRECCQCTYFIENKNRKGFGRCDKLHSTHNGEAWGCEYNAHDITGDCEYFEPKEKSVGVGLCRFCKFYRGYMGINMNSDVLIDCELASQLIEPKHIACSHWIRK